MTSSDACRVEPLLEVRGLVVEYAGGRRRSLRAVDGVNFSIGRGETVGLVGESGSGKTTIGRALLGLTSVTAGMVKFSGADITHATYSKRRTLATRLQVIFQDPFSSLNPTRTIGQTLGETLRVQGIRRRSAIETRVHSMLRRVGLEAEAAQRYPAQFSGGQRQRIAIARALMVNPELVICDEPVSALDLSVQAQVLNLLRELQDEFALSYLFIAHDLAVVRHVSHRIVVLYRGSVVEQGGADDVYRAPIHPYTRALLDAAPVPDPALQRSRRVSRDKPRTEGGDPTRSTGCPFAVRCRHAIDICRTTRPALELAPTGSLVACHRRDELQSPPPVSSSASAVM